MGYLDWRGGAERSIGVYLSFLVGRGGKWCHVHNMQTSDHRFSPPTVTRTRTSALRAPPKSRTGRSIAPLPWLLHRLSHLLVCLSKHVATRQGTGGVEWSGACCGVYSTWFICFYSVQCRVGRGDGFGNGDGDGDGDEIRSPRACTV